MTYTVSFDGANVHVKTSEGWKLPISIDDLPSDLTEAREYIRLQVVGEQTVRKEQEKKEAENITLREAKIAALVTDMDGVEFTIEDAVVADVAMPS